MRQSPADLPLVAALRGKGRLTLPKAARQQLALLEGDRVLIVVGRNTVELIPADLIPREKLWSLTGTVRRRIESAEDDITAGRSADLTNPRALGNAVSRLLNTDLSDR